MGFEMLEFFAVDRNTVENGYQLKKVFRLEVMQ